MVKIGKKTERVKVMSRRGHGSCCCVVGCSLTSGTNALSRIKMFQFPTDKIRWRAWVAAVQREAWEPKSRTRICSTHFTSGRPSADPGHPDYVPSLFPKRNTTEGSQTLLYHVRHNNPPTAEFVTPYFVETNPTDPGEQGTAASSVGTAPPVERVDNRLQADDEASKTEAASPSGTTSSREHDPFASQILCDDKRVHFYTGLPSASGFFALLSQLTAPRGVSSSLTPSQQLLLVLMKLRLGLAHQDLACRFQVGAGTVSMLCGAWLEVMAVELQCLIRWQTRREVRRSLPDDFLAAGFACVRCVLHCMEVRARRPTHGAHADDPHDRVKFLVGVSPSGDVTFLSRVRAGHVSGEGLTRDSGLIELLEQGDHVMVADQNLNLPEYFAPKEVQLRTPPCATRKGQPTRSEVVRSRKMSSMRINVDMAVEKIKSFRILSTLERSADAQFCTVEKLVTVCVALANLGKPLVSK